MIEVEICGLVVDAVGSPFAESGLVGGHTVGLQSHHIVFTQFEQHVEVDIIHVESICDSDVGHTIITVKHY